MEPVELTEKLLIEAGGWPVFRLAKAACEAGRVSDASWAAPLLQGAVLEGERTYRAGLKIESRVRIDNLCTCRLSRGQGTICHHSVAVGLAVLQAGRRPAAPATAPPRQSEVVAPVTIVPGFAVSSQPTHRVQIVLGSNLATTVSRGSVTLLVEAVALPASGGRLTTGAAKFQVSAADYDVLRSIMTLTGGAAKLPGMLILTAEKLLELFDELSNATSPLSFERRTRVEINSTPRRTVLKATQAADAEVTLDITWPTDGEMLIAGSQAWLLQRPKETPQPATIQPVVRGLPVAYQPLLSGRITLPPDAARDFFRLEWQRLGDYFDLQDETEPTADTTSSNNPSLPELVAQPTCVLKVEGSLNELVASLTATYPYGGKFLISEDLAASQDRGRNPAAERAALELLQSAGFRPAVSRAQHPFLGPGRHFFLRGQEPITRFFVHDLKILRARWSVETGPRFDRIFRDIEIVRPEIQLRPSSAQGWFEIDVELKTPSGQAYPAAEIQRLLRSNRTFIQLREGRSVGIAQEEIDDLAAVLQDCDPEQTQPGRYRIRAVHAGYLGASLAGWREGEAKDAANTLPARLASLLSAGKKTAREVAFPAALDQSLRDYQKAGVRWMLGLAAQQLAGILADEMGLGKTIQALAFLQLQPHEAPALIVCPTSLLTNWQREAARWTPDQRALVITGQDRATLFREMARADLVITSYALLRRDAERYRGVRFSSVILDEAHHIKNPDSQIARVARTLVADHRFVLTGTPIENSLRDLWSLLHFLLPGYLGSRQDFRERYEQPLQASGLSLNASTETPPLLGSNHAAADVRRRLQRRLQPFYLARRKSEVAKELPAKIEQIVSCELTAAQAEVYQQLLNSARQGLDDARRDKNAGRGRILALTALLRLRQACCDLRLLGLPGVGEEIAPDSRDADDENAGDLGATAEAHPHVTSGKLAMLDELLEQIREGNHRVLIFSQFVAMLKLLATHLRAAGVGFSYLDGQTKDRAGEVDRFQNDPAIAAFLISVKAGGTGLNLTGADTVIHFDPWWNPAVEAQATDRAHRIGQTRVVTSYKLIAAGTLEEKIVALQSRKRALAAEVLEFGLDASGPAGTLSDALTFDEIGDLLAG